MPVISWTQVQASGVESPPASAFRNVAGGASLPWQWHSSLHLQPEPEAEHHAMIMVPSNYEKEIRWAVKFLGRLKFTVLSS